MPHVFRFKTICKVKPVQLRFCVPSFKYLLFQKVFDHEVLIQTAEATKRSHVAYNHPLYTVCHLPQLEAGDDGRETKVKFPGSQRVTQKIFIRAKKKKDFNETKNNHGGEKKVLRLNNK